MRELELDGIHDDGEHVVLIDSDGDRYTLRITQALRAAVRLPLIHIRRCLPLFRISSL
ncbi:DUF3071 domain-containing protein [Enterobacter quasiroggenkampii]|nr:DUF3071 domain-containing protein [Enterobacter quasiroggenkampii]